MRAKPWVRLCSALAACLLVVLLCSACRTVPPPGPSSIPAAVPAPHFDQLFHRTDGGWTGGDGTLSVSLPDGRTVWLFGDSFLGPVSSDGRRPPEAPFIRNCLVVQQGDALETLFGRSHGKPSAFFEPSSAGQWYWPGHGTVEGDRLKIFLHRFEQREPGLWSWRWVGTDIATLSLPSLALGRLDPAPFTNQVMYGVFILKTRAYTYIYGTEDRRRPKAAHLARSASGQLQGPWRYFSGHGWSDTPAASRPILSGVSTQYAVLPAGGAFYLFTMDGRIPFSDAIVVYRAAHPWGPWKGPLPVYRAPEADEAVAAYNPFVHPQFTNNDRVLVSYNLNAVSDPELVYRNAAIYRPRFIRVDMTAVARRFESD
jgi:Domain of unknown function (DUF5005)/Domain of unknown function (DUF4185)